MTSQGLYMRLAICVFSTIGLQSIRYIYSAHTQALSDQQQCFHQYAAEAMDMQAYHGQ